MAKAAAPLGLRVILGIAFLGLAAATLTAVWPEFAQLFHALSLTYHHGDPPNPVAIASGTLALAAVFGVAGGLLRRRAPPWGLGIVVLVGFGGALSRMAADGPALRSWQSADVAILNAAHELAARMLSGTAAPKDPAAWQAALDSLASAKVVAVRNHDFAPVPFKVQAVKKGEVPPNAAPGTLLLWVSDDAVTFELTPIGFDEHDAPAPMKDEKGQLIVFKGVLKSEAQAQ